MENEPEDYLCELLGEDVDMAPAIDFGDLPSFADILENGVDNV